MSDKKKNDKKNDRYKDWLFLLWEDNHYTDYMQRLIGSGVQAAISPLHASDNWEYGDDMIDDPRVGLSPDLRDYNISLGDHNESNNGQNRRSPNISQVDRDDQKKFQLQNH